MVVTHEAALVHKAVHANDAPLTRILPHGDVAVVSYDGLLVRVHGYHDFIVVHLALQVLVIEVAARIEQRLLVVGFLH